MNTSPATVFASISFALLSMLLLAGFGSKPDAVSTAKESDKQMGVPAPMY